MKKIFLSLIIAGTLVACGKKENTANNDSTTGTTQTETDSKQAMIAGSSEKTWKAKRETNSEGEKDKLTKAEKEQRITFSRNGDVKMGDETQTLTGKWTLSGNTLALQFTGENITENFTVVEMEEDEIKLRAADGSEMTMKPE